MDASVQQEADDVAALVLVPGRRQPLGDQLYKRISAMFGVSRPVVRAALLRLRADGLLQARQGADTFVVHRPADRLTQLTDPGQVAGLLRCLEVRLPLEATAARMAAERRTASDLARIEAAQEGCRRESDEQGGMSPEADLHFHAAVAAASPNEMFADLLQHIHGVLGGFLRLSLHLTRTGSAERARLVLDEHAHILDAIASGDAEAAETAMRFHIGQARRRMIDRKLDR